MSVCRFLDRNVFDDRTQPFPGKKRRRRGLSRCSEQKHFDMGNPVNGMLRSDGYKAVRRVELLQVSLRGYSDCRAPETTATERNAAPHKLVAESAVTAVSCRHDASDR